MKYLVSEKIIKSYVQKIKFRFNEVFFHMLLLMIQLNEIIINSFKLLQKHVKNLLVTKTQVKLI